MLLFSCSRIICVIILNLLIQPMYAGDTLLLSKELTYQKEDARHLAQDTSSHKNESHSSVEVSGSQSLVSIWVNKLISYVSSKPSALRKPLDESKDERNSIKVALKELPFYKESLPKGFNSSLSSKAQLFPLY